MAERFGKSSDEIVGLIMRLVELADSRGPSFTEIVDAIRRDSLLSPWNLHFLTAVPYPEDVRGPHLQAFLQFSFSVLAQLEYTPIILETVWQYTRDRPAVSPSSPVRRWFQDRFSILLNRGNPDALAIEAYRVARRGYSDKMALTMATKAEKAYNTMEETGVNTLTEFRELPLCVSLKLTGRPLYPEQKLPLQSNYAFTQFLLAKHNYLDEVEREVMLGAVTRLLPTRPEPAQELAKIHQAKSTNAEGKKEGKLQAKMAKMWTEIANQREKARVQKLQAGLEANEPAGVWLVTE